MIPALVPVILQAALQALFAAAAVWAGLRALRVANVLVQKAAWALVLIAALALPMASRWQPLPAWATFRLPGIAPDPMPPSTQASNSETALTATPALAEPSTSQRQPGSQPVTAAPDAYDASSTSTVNLNAPVWSALPANSVTEGEPSSPAPVSESRPGVKGTGSSPYINSAKSPRSLVPEGSHAQSRSIPNSSAAPANTAAPAYLPIRLAGIALLIYLAVFVALLLRLLFGLASALRIWITAVPISELPDFDRASAGMSLRSSPRVASPVNIGSGIVLPADYAGWDEEKLRIVVAHEHSHVRQRDFYLQLLAGLYACLFWFSPLGWWLKRKLYELGEAISDHAGLEEAASRSSYAQLLLEFAALPRPTLTGVAMARSSHLSQRIERLLNESSFRQAFAAGGRRALLSVLLVPIALLAATTLVRVQAATPAPAAQASVAGQSTPEQVTEPTPVPAAAPAPEAAPAPPSTPASAPEPASQAAPPPPPAGPGEPGLAPVAPEPPNPGIAPMAPMPPTMGAMPPMPPMQAFSEQFRTDRMRLYPGAFDYSEDGDPYALVQSDGKVTMPSGGLFNGRYSAGQESIEKARKMANGAFLWFQHEGKTYIVDDPAIVAQIEAMNKPMDELGAQMRDLGKQMREVGEQQRGLGEKMRDANVPTPDLSKEIADLNAAAAALKAKQGSTITQKDLSELQREIGRIQGQLGALQGRIGAQQGDIGGEMGKFGEQQGKLGGQMGKLGAQMGQVARENQAKVKGIITDSLSNGKAKPVQ